MVLCPQVEYTGILLQNTKYWKYISSSYNTNILLTKQFCDQKTLLKYQKYFTI